MAVFKAIKNLPSVQSHPCATTSTISKGVPVRISAGLVTVCATNVCDVLGVAHETIASGNDGTIKVLPAVGPNGPAVFQVPDTTIAATSSGKCYLLAMATNAATLSAASTTLGAFFVLTADATNATGCFTGNAFQGVLSLTA